METKITTDQINIVISNRQKNNIDCLPQIDLDYVYNYDDQQLFLLRLILLAMMCASLAILILTSIMYICYYL
jgi:hypothetical protein